MARADYPGRRKWRFHNADRDFDFTPTLHTISISQEYPDMVAVMDCDVVDEAAALTFAPEDKCWASIGGIKVWAGHLKTVTEAQKSEFGPRVWRLHGQDYTAKLGDAIITRRKKRKKEKAVRRVRWLLNQLERRVWNLASRDLSNIPDVIVEAYDYYGATVDEGLQHVADETRTHFFIDLDNVFQMFRDDYLAAPIGLDNEAPDYEATFPFREWEYDDDSVALANATLVEPEKRKHSRWDKDATSIAAYGRHERFISDQNIHRPKQAKNVASRTVQQGKDPEDEGRLLVHQPGLYAGMTVAVREALWDHDRSYFIQSATIEGVDPHDDDEKAYVKTYLTIAKTPKRKRRNRAGINRNARRRPGQLADVDPYLLDDFSRTVAPPATVAGAATGMTFVPYKLTWGQNECLHAGVLGGATYLGPGALYGPTLTALSQAYASWRGYAISGSRNITWPVVPVSTWTATPSRCGVGLGAWSGWEEREVWFAATVPAHPADMAGIRLGVSIRSWEGSGFNGAYVRVLSTAPTLGGQGAPVGHAPGHPTVWYQEQDTEVVIPASEVPAEGGTLWVGMAPAWRPDYSMMDRYVCVKDPTPRYSGVFYAALESATWEVLDSGDTDFGAMATVTKAPWEGGNAWHDGGSEGGTFGMDGTSVYLTGPGGRGIYALGSREDDDEPRGPWSDMGWAAELRFSATALASGGSITLTTTGEGEQTIGTIDLDSTPAITVKAPNVTETASKSIGANESWVAKFDSRSGWFRGKCWEATTGEPTAWDVEVEMAETEDDADRVEMWLRAGTGQTVKVHRFRAFDDADNGKRVIREYLGVTSGATNRFKTNHPFREGTLLLRVGGINTPPSKEDGDATTFQLDARPTADMTLRATYTADQGTGDE